MRYGVIMAGGAGTRLWPLSREDKPKQMLSVGGKKSLMELAFDRLSAVVPTERIYVCTAAAHKEATLALLPDLPPANVIGEPCGRDTTNAIGFSATVLKKIDPDAVIGFISVDQIITPIDTFAERLSRGFDIVEERPQSLVTLGIVPTYPNTSLGYIERSTPLSNLDDSYAVSSFKEKPDFATATSYVDSGRFYWNSGMFVWRADTVLNEMAANVPEAYQGLMKIADAWDTPAREEVLANVYPELPKISIDYSVMEPAASGEGAAEVAVVEAPVDWLDVGTWPTLAETLDTDSSGNSVAASTIFVDSGNNIVVSDDPDHLIAAVGLRDSIIVHTADATLVLPRSAAARMKELVAAVADQDGDRRL